MLRVDEPDKKNVIGHKKFVQADFYPVLFGTEHLCDSGFRNLFSTEFVYFQCLPSAMVDRPSMK